VTAERGAEDVAAGSRAAVRLGVAAVVLGLAALLAWAALAPLHGAVVASGLVKAAGNRKLVQHAEGGTVGRLLVRNGDRVAAGQPVLELVDPRVDANLEILRGALVLESVRRARLDAQQRLLRQFAAPKLAGADARALAEAYAREARIFETRRALLDRQIQVYGEQIQAIAAEQAGLRRQLESTRQSAALAREELELNTTLLREQFVARARIIALERTLAEYTAKIGEHEAALTQAEQRRHELSLRAATAPAEYQRAAAEEFRESEARLLQLAEQLRPAEDAARRQAVLAPAAGRVVNLRVNAPGEVVSPREPLMEIVPEGEDLVVEARVPLDAIRHLRLQQPAELRFTTFNSRQTPMVLARVAYVSDDALSDREGHAAYLVHLSPDTASLAQAGISELRPGMAAEVYVLTAPRSALDYLLAPITDSLRRALREP